MSAERELERTVRSWLREDGREDADRLLGAVMAEVDATPQSHAGWWPPRRSSARPMQIAIAAALLLAAALVGYRLVSSPLIGPPPSPSPTTAPTVITGGMGSIESGTYTMSAPDLTTVPFTFTVGSGWSVDSSAIIMRNEGAGSYVGFTAWVVTHVYSDACAWKDALVDVGTDVDQMADELAAQEGRDTPIDSQVEIDGYPGRLITTTSDPFFDISNCYLQHLHVWPDPGPDESGGNLSQPGQTDEVYVVDVAGTRAVIAAYYGPETSQAAIDELHAIVDSVRFEPAP